MNWEAYDELPPELQNAVDFNNEVVHELTGEPIPERDD